MRLATLLTLSACTICTVCALPARGQTTGNPILRGAADPHAAVFGDRLYAYPTTGGGQFRAYSSSNLGDWRDEGVILDFGDVSWTNSGNSWAPAMHRRGDDYFFYYSVGGPTSYIGVATGSSPTGPFTDKGSPLLSDDTGFGPQFEAIDPMVFEDPASGKTYLYAGGSRGSSLRVFELGDDLTSIERQVAVDTPSFFTEGAFMHERDGTYYLSYSSGRWYGDDYSVHYATSDSPVGPWTYRSEILTKNDEDKGPGHHSFFVHPDNDETYIVYHRWEDRFTDGTYDGARDTAIELVSYDASGLINPIALTNGGVPLAPIPEPTSLAVVASGALLLVRRR